MNNKQIISFVTKIGIILGQLCWLPNYFSYILYILKQGFYTGKYKKYFNTFGNGSLISHDVELVRPKYIDVGENTEFCPYVILEMNKIRQKDPILKIGDNCQFGEFTHITSANKILIGNRVLTGRFVLITDNSHGDTAYETLSIPPRLRKLYSKGQVIIEDDVWIGDKATILPNVKIGHNSVVAANSIVSKDVPPFSLVHGINKIINRV